MTEKWEAAWYATRTLMAIFAGFGAVVGLIYLLFEVMPIAVTVSLLFILCVAGLWRSYYNEWLGR